jgi:hypothetical protein
MGIKVDVEMHLKERPELLVRGPECKENGNWQNQEDNWDQKSNLRFARSLESLTLVR